MMTDLDTKLQEIALKNWQQFTKLIGEDAVRAAKVCLLRKGNKSYGEIAIKLKITERQAGYACKNCDDIEPEKT